MNAAKCYYEAYHQINPPKLGRFFNPRLFTVRHKRQLENLDKLYGKDIWREISQCKKETKQNEIFLPSPWHAWVLLIDPRFTNINKQQLGVPTQFFVPAYRGQANANYAPIPSLYRDATKRQLEQDYLEIFSFLFNQKFLWQHFEISLPSNSAKAAAQHYAIKTDFLDITADPAVAIYFASRSRERKYGDTAAVFIFDLSPLLSSSFNLILPPPFLERLYLQRGAFITFPEIENRRIQESYFKLSFPFNSEFQFFDEGKPKNIRQSVHDIWFQKAITWSKQWVNSGKRLPHEQNQINRLVAQVFEEIGYPNLFPDNNPFFALAHWMDNFEDMIYWYGIRVLDGYEGYLPNVCKNIARNNSELVKTMINVYNALGKTELRNAWIKYLG